MKRIFILSLLILIVLIGCSNDDAYNNSIQKGLDYIASEEYEKAESAFELALDEKAGDDKATALLEQTRYYQELLDAVEENELDVANEKFNNIINIENGSSTLNARAKDTIESTKATQEEDNLPVDEAGRAEGEETDQTKDRKKSSNNANYERYDNGPYGYSIDYPTTFSPGPMQGDNDGVRFRGGEADIYVSGSHHESKGNSIINPNDPDSMKRLFDREISKAKENDFSINYQKLDEENNWFVISYTVADDIIYQKNLGAEHSFAELIIAYPKDSQDKYESMVEKVAGSFTIKDEN